MARVWSDIFLFKEPKSEKKNFEGVKVRED